MSETNMIEKIRPVSFERYIGQKTVKENLQVYINAAKIRGTVLDHVLISGPSGTGKTTLAGIIAQTFNARLKVIFGPLLRKVADITSTLANVKEGDVIFIDEIHAISKEVMELLYPVVEDRKLNIAIGEGTNIKVINLALPPFTLIGATTNPGELTRPFKDRFGIVLELQTYEVADLTTIIKNSAQQLNISLDPEAAYDIAKRARRTPRIANRLLLRLNDFACNAGTGINKSITATAFECLGINEQGLGKMDDTILKVLANASFPVGIESLATITNSDAKTLEQEYEPFLVQEGYILKSPRGRTITNKGLSIVLEEAE